MLSYVTYLFFRVCVSFFRLIPESCAYACSYGLFYVIFVICSVRRRIVMKNLTICFPKMTEREKWDLAKKHYQYLSEMFVETMRMSSLSLKEAKKRFVVTNGEFVQSYLDQHKSVMVWTGHFSNVDYFNIAAAYYPLVAIYRSLRNKTIDQWFKQSRSMFGSHLCQGKQLKPLMKQTGGRNRDYSACLFGLASDQYATNKQHTSVHFFGRDTTFFVGPERLAGEYGLPMVYMSVRLLRRGYYTATFYELKKSSRYKFGNYTQEAATLLEQDIKQDPARYFWLHNRWKDVSSC